MCPLRRVRDDRAGPAALGILVPPGRQTFLILRPRALPWDLLLVRAADAPDFHHLPQAEADRLAGELARALDDWPRAPGRVEAVAEPGGGHRLLARVGPFALLACPRLPGQPYRPLVFADAAEAREAADRLAPVLCPPPGVEQELYFNTRHFAP